MDSSTTSIENENQKSIGAAGLLGLFGDAPPQGGTENGNSKAQNGGETANDNNKTDESFQSSFFIRQESLDPDDEPNEKSNSSSSSRSNKKKSDPLVGLFSPPTAAADMDSSDRMTESAENDGTAGSVSHMMNLFAAPKSTSSSYSYGIQPRAGGGGGGGGRHEQKSSLVTLPEDGFSPEAARGPPPRMFALERQSTAPRSNKFSDAGGENTPLLSSSLNYSPMSSSSFSAGTNSRDSSLRDLFVSSTDATPKAGLEGRKGFASPSTVSSHIRMPSVALPAIEETQTFRQNHKAWRDLWSPRVKVVLEECIQPTTYIGSFMFLLYHVVFCLAMGSAIHRPNNPSSILGLMTKTASLGIVCSASVYWIGISHEIPAIYPTVDLFLAPFLAGLAATVDEELANDDSVSDEDNDAVFLATFGVLTSLGIICSASLLTLASVFKLANLGSYLPFPVICGFFSAVGVLTWTLAVSVDTNGKKIGQILMSGDVDLMLTSLIHHIPSVCVAALMKYLGPKNPFYVVMVVCCTVATFYIVMFWFGISLDDAREMGWFWSKDDLVYTKGSVGFENWSPPAPFGVLHDVLSGLVHWGAVFKGLSTALALGFLYMIRCSVHGTALRKNIPNLVRYVRNTGAETAPPPPPMPNSPKPYRPTKNARKFSEAVDIEAVMQPTPTATTELVTKREEIAIRPKPTNMPLKLILTTYGCSQVVSALVGGFAITPSVAAAPTMYTLGAERVAPQVGSVLLLFTFYMTDFKLIEFIPKPAFSSMLVLSFIDMTYTWFYKSYFKTKDKSEWLVVPSIVFVAFALDLLSSVFLGIALSTFIFVASFFRSGVVKFVSDGRFIHSTIERTFKNAEWLNHNGDFIQIVVLQNYLFFGNASSVYNYIATFFAIPVDDIAGVQEPPARIPKFVIIDLTLVTGMDTSTVDVFSDIKNLCAANNCKFFMAGTSPGLRSILALGGVKPESGTRADRQLRFFGNLDVALGKAEDIVLDSDLPDQGGNWTGGNIGSRRRLVSEGDHGFRTALRHIDEQHGDNFSMDLAGLLGYTTPIVLKTGERLYASEETSMLDRGLFFIETGVMKIERSSGDTLTRGSFGSMNKMNGNSLNKIQSMFTALMQNRDGETQTFRLARIGPGWVAGTLEAVSGMRRQGDHVALTDCKLWHLPYNKLERIEMENPRLVLSLYKLLSYLMARRQEATIGQLATLHQIMTSPPHTRPLR